METIQAIILGIVQGASEFLPISSSAHLFLIPKILDWGGVLNSLTFDVALHIGTTLAVLIFFWKDWLELITSFFRNLPKGWSVVWNDPKSRLLVFLVVGTIPAGILGFLFDNYFENQVRNIPLVAFAMIAFAVILFIADRIGKKTRSITQITLADSISIGLAQAVALIPGVSRSGITITTGLFRDIDRESATKFSFLLSTPTILGASILKFKDLLHGSIDPSSSNIFLAGTVAAAISGFLAIKILLKFVQSNNFNIFVIYRILLGIAVLAAFIGI